MNILQTFAEEIFGGDAIDRKSTSGAVITYNNSQIFWSTKKHTIMAISTTEAEYNALTSAAKHDEVIKMIYIDAQIMADDPCAENRQSQSRSIIDATKATRNETAKIYRYPPSAAPHFIKHNQFRVMHVTGDIQNEGMLTKPLQRVLFWRQCQTVNIGHVSPC